MPVEPVNEHAKPRRERFVQIFVDGKGKKLHRHRLILNFAPEDWIKVA